MDYGTIIVVAIIAFVAARILYGRLKYGSWSGSFLKGTIARTVGEIELVRRMSGTLTLTVQLMRGSEDSEDFVGLVLVSKAALAASMQTYRFSKAQARELASYLSQAAA
jgi:hypothetical protein